jgi:hypothetical protein
LPVTSSIPSTFAVSAGSLVVGAVAFSFQMASSQAWLPASKGGDGAEGGHEGHRPLATEVVAIEPVAVDDLRGIAAVFALQPVGDLAQRGLAALVAAADVIDRQPQRQGADVAEVVARIDVTGVEDGVVGQVAGADEVAREQAAQGRPGPPNTSIRR